jgi:uncharacterized membrane protein YeaQ/YmgE (transglycosylase-associated protein family)
MNWLMGFIGATVAGWIGWYVGDLLFGMTGAFIISMVASGFGLYYGKKWSKQTFGL